jgi:hypothetical protein
METESDNFKPGLDRIIGGLKRMRIGDLVKNVTSHSTALGASFGDRGESYEKR